VEEYVYIILGILSFRGIHKVAKSRYQLCHVCASVCPPHATTRIPAGQMFVKFYIGGFREFCQEN